MKDSTSPYAFVRSDAIKKENTLRLIKEEFRLDRIVEAKQVHGDAVILVDATTPSGLSADALMTNQPGVGLLIKHADCQAAIFYDPVHRAIANVHSGWRGSVANIYARVVEAMAKAYNTRPEDLIVCIGPSLGPESGEFINYRTELPEPFWNFQVKPNYFDFWEISKWQLMNLGVREQRIEIAKIDTKKRDDICFSYRRDKEYVQQHATFVALENLTQYS